MPLKLKFEPENLKTSSEGRNHQFQTTGVKNHCYFARNVLIIFIFIAKLIHITVSNSNCQCNFLTSIH
jgi:hypothetical protein